MRVRIDEPTRSVQRRFMERRRQRLRNGRKAASTLQLCWDNVGRERLYAVALHPNRTGGSPASSFPVRGRHAMNRLRPATQGFRKSCASRAGLRLAHPHGRFTLGRRRVVRLGVPMHQHAQPCGTMLTLAGEQSFTHPDHVPSPLRSTIITRFLATTEALTPTGPLTTGRCSLIHVARTSDHSISNHLRISTSRDPALAALWCYGLRHCSSGSPNPPTETSSFWSPHWEHALRTGCSFPVALHPGLSPRRSYFQLLALQWRPGWGLPPRCPSALSGARNADFSRL